MKAEDIQALVRPNIRQLCPYSTARDEFEGSIGVFLDANESPYPSGWNRYPDPHQKALKQMIAPMKGVKTDNIFLGNGSDEAIDLIFRIFCVPGEDNIVAISPSYGMYEVAADINDIACRKVQLDADFTVRAEDLLAACDSRTKAVFLCSPNNPSGNAIPNETVFDILERFNGMVVVDEAYIDFCSVPSLVPAVEKYPNLIVLQTFSKARGMAALRLGMAFAQPYTIRLMSMVKYPYNINASTQKLAMEALSRPVDREVAEIIAQRVRLVHKFLRFTCIRRTYPSEANFLLVKVDDADALYAHLLADGIIVRNRTKVPGCKDCLRITVGLPEENDRLLQSLERYEKESHIRR